MVRNAEKLYYPLVESIKSILDMVDEYVVVIGNNDPDDGTLEMVESIKSDKIKIYRSEWDFKAYPGGSELAHQTDIAKSYCTGDWLFYLQADEIVDAKEHLSIRHACMMNLHNKEVEGLIFRYLHFWGDYNHAFVDSHAWYRREIRIIRNLPDIHSWRDAQSFRVIPDFTKEKYLQKEGTRKLNVAEIDAHIYHYGWVRPPQLMGKKQIYFEDCYKDENRDSVEEVVISEMDFGAMELIPKYKGTHPAIMKDRIAQFNWGDKLNYTHKLGRKPKHKHEKLKYKLLTWIEHKWVKNGLCEYQNHEVLSEVILH